MCIDNIFSDTIKCPVCQKTLIKEERIIKAVYLEEIYEYPQTGFWCEDCESSYFTEDDLKGSCTERKLLKSKIKAKRAVINN